jgi:hypothetical protein
MAKRKLLTMEEIAGICFDYVYFDDTTKEIGENYDISLKSISKLINRGIAIGFVSEGQYSGASRRKMSESHIGKTLSGETRRRMSEAKNGEKHHNYGKPLSVEHRRKLSMANFGKRHSDETRRRLSKASSGKTHSEKSRRKIANTRRENGIGIGDKNPNFNGWSSLEPYSPEFVFVMRNVVRERDNYECRTCGVEENGKSHDVHHIDYDKDNNSGDNLILLCRGCHTQTNGMVSREIWTELYSEAIGRIYESMSGERQAKLEKLRTDLMNKHGLEDKAE